MLSLWVSAHPFHPFSIPNSFTFVCFVKEMEVDAKLTDRSAAPRNPRLSLSHSAPFACRCESHQETKASSVLRRAGGKLRSAGGNGFLEFLLLETELYLPRTAAANGFVTSFQMTPLKLVFHAREGIRIYIGQREFSRFIVSRRGLAV